MTVKELKRMLEDIDDDAILLTRSALEPSEFEQPSTVVTVRGRVMLPRWAYACNLVPDGAPMKAILID